MVQRSLKVTSNSLIADDLEILEADIINIFGNQSQIDKDLLSFIAAPAKRLRPSVGLMFLRAAFGDINIMQRKILLAVELIHNATLIHDDVIDESSERRGKISFNAKFSNSLAVVAGDFLLSIAMEKILETSSLEVLKVFTNALKSVCVGEINQYFSKYEIPTLDKYIEKSMRKTATLFEIGLISGVLVSSDSSNLNLLNSASNFAKNFGIAFQIRDDILNVLNNGNDINSGIYTAPLIFAQREVPDILDKSDILTVIKATGALAKSKDLMDNYFEDAISAIAGIPQNMYKDGILALIESLKVSL